MSLQGLSGTRLACRDRASAQVARLLRSAGARTIDDGPPWQVEPEGSGTVKKLLLVVLLGLSAFAVWRKVQADRAELDLWTEATTADD